MTAVVYPCCFSERGAKLGPETIARLEQLKKLCLVNSQIKKIVLTAGFCPRRCVAPNQKETFAQMMKKWLIENSVAKDEDIVISDNPRIWTSWHETLEMIKIIDEKFLPKNVLIVSTMAHVYPRLFMTWNMLRPHGWRISFSGASYPYGFRQFWRHEIPGTGYYFLKCLKFVFVHRFSKEKTLS